MKALTVCMCGGFTWSHNGYRQYVSGARAAMAARAAVVMRSFGGEECRCLSLF